MITPRVHIVLLNWNQREDTSECLESLRKLLYGNYEITVVDNHSTDGSYEYLSQKYEHVRFLRNEENLGFAGGMNTGITYAAQNGADYVLIMNSDTVASPQLVDKLVELCESDKKIGIAGPVIYNYYEPLETDFAGGYVNPTFGIAKHLSKKETQPFETGFMTGCCMLIRTEILTELGGFDADFFVLCEDLDISLRFRRAGYKIMCHPGAALWHKISTKINRKIGYYFWFRNTLLIIRRYGIFPFRITGLAKIIVLHFGKCFFTSMVSGKRGEIRSLLWGVSDYYGKRFNRGRLSDILKLPD